LRAIPHIKRKATIVWASCVFNTRDPKVAQRLRAQEAEVAAEKLREDGVKADEISVARSLVGPA
jgi:hypothetical protein